MCSATVAMSRSVARTNGQGRVDGDGGGGGGGSVGGDDSRHGDIGAVSMDMCTGARNRFCGGRHSWKVAAEGCIGEWREENEFVGVVALHVDGVSVMHREEMAVI